MGGEPYGRVAPKRAMARLRATAKKIGIGRHFFLAEFTHPVAAVYNRTTHDCPAHESSQRV